MNIQNPLSVFQIIQFMDKATVVAFASFTRCAYLLTWLQNYSTQNNELLGEHFDISYIYLSNNLQHCALGALCFRCY